MTSLAITGTAELSVIAAGKSAGSQTEGIVSRPSAAGGNTLPQQGQQSVGVVSQEALEEAVSKISNYVQTISRQLSFSIDDTTGNTVVTVLDRETDEIIRQVPSEEALAISRFIDDLLDVPAKGVLVQNKA